MEIANTTVDAIREIFFIVNLQLICRGGGQCASHQHDRFTCLLCQQEMLRMRFNRVFGRSFAQQTQIRS